LKLEGELFESLKKSENKKQSKIYSIIFYLNPGDYHRFHSPTDLTVKRSNHIAGFLHPVKEDYLTKNQVIYSIRYLI